MCHTQHPVVHHLSLTFVYMPGQKHLSQTNSKVWSTPKWPRLSNRTFNMRHIYSLGSTTCYDTPFSNLFFLYNMPFLKKNVHAPATTSISLRTIPFRYWGFTSKLDTFMNNMNLSVTFLRHFSVIGLPFCQLSRGNVIIHIDSNCIYSNSFHQEKFHC